MIWVGCLVLAPSTLPSPFWVMDKAMRIVHFVWVRARWWMFKPGFNITHVLQYPIWGGSISYCSLVRFSFIQDQLYEVVDSFLVHCFHRFLMILC